MMSQDARSDSPAATSASRSGDPVRIRTASRVDVPGIWELVRGLARYERLEHELTSSADRLAEQLFEHDWPKVECLVAEHGEQLVGFALYYGCYSSFSGRTFLWLEDLFVSEHRRGAGVGLALMRELARRALDRGCVRIEWEVLDWNQPSIEFYERLGSTRGTDWFAYSLSGEPLANLAQS